MFSRPQNGPSSTPQVSYERGTSVQGYLAHFEEAQQVMLSRTSQAVGVASSTLFSG